MRKPEDTGRPEFEGEFKMQIILLAESLKQTPADVAPEGQVQGSADQLVSDLAKSAGVSQAEIRFYESQGLLTSSGKGKWRTCDPENVDRLKAIIKLRKMGLSLARIREAMSCAELPDRERGQEGLRRILEERIVELNEIAEMIRIQLHEARQHLARLAELSEEGEKTADVNRQD